MPGSNSTLAAGQAPGGLGLLPCTACLILQPAFRSEAVACSGPAKESCGQTLVVWNACHPLTTGCKGQRLQGIHVLQGPHHWTSALQVSEGSGSMVVIAVGLNSEYGKTMSLVMTEAEDTPLQETLAVLAAAIGKVGLFVAVVCFCVLLIR